MNCPPEIADALCDILRTGVLQIRSAGWSNDANLAATLADHIHNLPSLLSEFSHEPLTYYWEIERPCFLQAVDRQVSDSYANAWGRLEAHVIPQRHPLNTAVSP